MSSSEGSSSRSGSSRSSGSTGAIDSSDSRGGSGSGATSMSSLGSHSAAPIDSSDIGLTDEEIGLKYRVLPKTMKKYRKVFDAYDKDRNQFIDARELKLVLRQLGQDSSAANVQVMLDSADQDADNRVNFGEFVRMLVQVEKHHLRELYLAFSVFDADASGFIDEKELLEVMHGLGKSLTPSALRAMLAEADVNHDGRVSFREFVRIVGYDGELHERDEILTSLSLIDSESDTSSSDSRLFAQSSDSSVAGDTGGGESASVPEGSMRVAVHAFYLGDRYRITLSRTATFGELATHVANATGYALAYHRFYYEGLPLELGAQASEPLAKLGINGSRPVFFLFLRGKFTVVSADVWDADGLPRLDVIYDVFRKEERIPAADACAIVDRARAVLRREPNMLELWEPLTVVGDLHGQFYDLEEVFRAGGAINGRVMHLFLGDYVDRGYFSCEVILFLLAAKLRYPDKVFMLRGNHESRKTTEKYGTLTECRLKYGKKLYQRLMLAFDALPLYALVHTGDHRVLMMHGGLSHRVETLDDIERIDRFHEPPREGPLKDVLWTDPHEDCDDPRDTAAPRVWNLRALKRRNVDAPDSFTSAHFRPCARGDALQTFSHAAVLTFLKRNDLLSIFRAHEQKSNGYELYKYGPKYRFPGVVTVFSAPNYTDKSMNAGAVVVIADGIVTFHPYKWRLHPLCFDHAHTRAPLEKDLVQEDLVQFVNWLHPQVLRRLPLATLNEEFYEMFCVDRSATRDGRSGAHLWSFLDDNLAQVMQLSKDRRIRRKYRKKTLAMMLWYQGFDQFSVALKAESEFERDVTVESQRRWFCGSSADAAAAGPAAKSKATQSKRA